MFVFLAGDQSLQIEEGAIVYRYLHGRVFAAIFGPFPFAARGAFTVHTSYPSHHPSPIFTPSNPLTVTSRLSFTQRNGHARCWPLCKRVSLNLSHAYRQAEGHQSCLFNLWIIPSVAYQRPRRTFDFNNLLNSSINTFECNTHSIKTLGTFFGNIFFSCE